jgi:hypothetical protein
MSTNNYLSGDKIIMNGDVEHQTGDVSISAGDLTVSGDLTLSTTDPNSTLSLEGVGRLWQVSNTVYVDNISGSNPIKLRTNGTTDMVTHASTGSTFANPVTLSDTTTNDTYAADQALEVAGGAKFAEDVFIDNGSSLVVGGAKATGNNRLRLINSTTSWIDFGTGSLVFRNSGHATRMTLNQDGDLTLSAGDFILESPTVPSSASDTGTAGTIAWDASYVYVCTATDTWKRVAIATW